MTDLSSCVFLVRMETQTTVRAYHALGRWNRGSVRPIALNARDLDYLHTLFIHGVLSSDMLRALVAPANSQRVTTDRLFLLKNLPNEYVRQPKAQERVRNAHCAHLVFEICERGARALVDFGRITYDDYQLWTKLQINFKPQHFDHDHALGYVLASFALGARERGITFISWRDIINRSRCPMETRESRNPLAIPYEIGGERHDLIPDGLFGLQYAGGACFFALEIDRGTEQHKDNARKSATLHQKFRAYRCVMRDGVFTSRFGLPSFLVLTVTPGIVRMRNMIEHIGRLGDSDPGPFTRSMLFKAIPTLATGWAEKPPVNGHLLNIPWDRAGHPQLELTNL